MVWYGMDLGRLTFISIDDTRALQRIFMPLVLL